MFIELRGVEFVNKGAELMLHAIMQTVKKNIPDAQFAMELIPRVSAENLRDNNIYVKRGGKKAKFLPKFIRRKLRFVLPAEIDVVFDGSGFAFGDQWGDKYAERRLGSKIMAWRKEGKKVILLPQAFGPFNNPALREVMQKIIDNSVLVFARENQSYEYLKRISTNDNIIQAPDFTNLLTGKVPENFDSVKNQVAIIPNYKMIDKKTEDGDVYVNFLYNAIKKVDNLGFKPYFLIHEGERDIAIAKQVNNVLQNPIEIIVNTDPLMIKGIISTAYFIVCSRFHGVVSALSQGVPCISTSWSHKYEMLHQEYDYEEGLLKDIADNGETEQKIEYLADAANNKTISEKLTLNSVKQKERSVEMWKTVFKAINVKK